MGWKVILGLALLFSLIPNFARAEDWHTNNITMVCEEYSQMRTMTDLAMANDIDGMQRYARQHPCRGVKLGSKVHVLEQLGPMWRVRVEGTSAIVWTHKDSLSDWGSRK